MAGIGDLFSGFVQGANMAQNQAMREEQLKLQKRRAQLEEMQSLIQITELPENIQEPFLQEWLKTNGVDPKGEDGKGKFYMDLFKKASSDQRKALAQTLANLGLEGKFNLESLGKADIKTVLSLAPEMAKHQQAKQDSETIRSIFTDVEKSEPPSTQASKTQTPQDASQTALVNGGTNGGPAIQTQSRMVQGGPNTAPMVGGMPPIAQRNLELYQKLQKAATLVSNKDTRKELLDRADKLADNSWITLTPIQSAQLGFKQGAIVQYNAIKNDAKVLQQGETSWRTLSPEQKKSLGIGETDFAQQSSMGEVKVTKNEETYEPVPKEQNPAGVEVPLQKSSRGKLSPIVPGPSTVMAGEKKFEGERGKDDAEYLKNIRAQRETATAKIAAADQVEAAVQGFQTGAFGDQRKFLASVAELFGAQDAFAQITKGDVVSAEVIDKVNGELVSKIPGAFKNTNATEIKIIQSNFPTLSRSVPGNKIVVDLMRKDAELDDAIADMAENHPGQPSEKDASGKNLYQKIAEYKRANPLIDDAMKKRIRGTVAFSKKVDPTGTTPLPPKEYPDANFIGYHPETGNPRFQTKEGRIFQMQLGE